MTRIIFLVLLLANVGFFTYNFLLSETDEAAAQISLLQISPERIKPVATESVATIASAPLAAKTQTQSTCIEWGSIAAPDVARADAAFQTLALPAAATQRRVSDHDGYWVHMAPLKNKAEVDRKVGELKALGVTDFYVVQDAGRWRNAVSLGLFKGEDAARAQLAALRKRGVVSATITRREKFLRQVAYIVRDPSEATIARFKTLQREFPASDVKVGVCSADAPEKS